MDGEVNGVMGSRCQTDVQNVGERERRGQQSRCCARTLCSFVHILRRERPMEVISLVFSRISHPFTRIHDGTQRDVYV